MGNADSIQVEVAYARPGEQLILSLEVPLGTTLEQAVLFSGIGERFAEIDLANAEVGIFGRLSKRDVVLRPGDRVEIYRPLLADPKEIRKRRAAQGKRMKRRDGGDDGQ